VSGLTLTPGPSPAARERGDERFDSGLPDAVDVELADVFRLPISIAGEGTRDLCHGILMR